jgi:hypothetical protein
MRGAGGKGALVGSMAAQQGGGVRRGLDMLLKIIIFTPFPLSRKVGPSWRAGHVGLADQRLRLTREHGECSASAPQRALPRQAFQARHSSWRRTQSPPRQPACSPSSALAALCTAFSPPLETRHAAPSALYSRSFTVPSSGTLVLGSTHPCRKDTSNSLPPSRSPRSPRWNLPCAVKPPGRCRGIGPNRLADPECGGGASKQPSTRRSVPAPGNRG